MCPRRSYVPSKNFCDAVQDVYNKKVILQRSDNGSSEATWAESSCVTDSLYDLSSISEIVPVILDNSNAWDQVVSKTMKLEDIGIAHERGVSRDDLKLDDRYLKILLINRTASPLAWFGDFKDRHNLSAIMLPHSFLPSMANKLRDAADKIKLFLGDYDVMHVRRGDILKRLEDRFEVFRSLHQHLYRDTRPEIIMRRIEKWVPPGRMLFNIYSFQ